MTASTASPTPSTSPPAGFDDTSQDFHTFLAAYRAAYPDDVLTVRDPVAADQDPTALVWALAAHGQDVVGVRRAVRGQEGVEVLRGVIEPRRRWRG